MAIDIRAQLKTPLKDCINTITGLTTIFMNPNVSSTKRNAKRPQMPYIAFNLTNITKVGQDRYTKLEDDGTALYEATRRMIVNIECYGKNAAGYLEELRKYFTKNINNCLGSINLSYVREVSFNKIPIALNNTHEERWEFNSIFLFGTTAEFTKDIVNQVEASVEIKNFNNDIIDNFNLIVS